jgi:chromosome segregation ATPase
VVVESHKENKDLKIKEASAIAERDRLSESLEVLQGKYRFMESTTSKTLRELRTTVTRYENQLKEAAQVNAKMREKAVKLAEAEKSLAAGLTANQKLANENKALKDEIAALKDSKEKGLLKKYVETKTTQIGFVLPNNALTLLEACKTEAEVDTLIDQFRDVMREESLHSDVSAEKTDLTEKKGTPANPGDQFEESVGALYGSIR